MTRPEIAGVHHLKIPVTDLAQSRVWYQKALGLQVILEFPDGQGVVRGLAGTVPGLGSTMLALREDRELAVALRGFDPIAFAVTDLATLEGWATYLDEQQIAHTPTTRATTGWLIAADDPDGTHVLLYANDETATT